MRDKTRRRTRGQAPHKPRRRLRRQVETLCSFGIPETAIASFIGIDPKTLRKYYRHELDLGKPKANARVGSFLITAASGDALEDGATYSDCIRAAMFWAKTQMGFRETNRHELTSPDGSMSPPNKDLSHLSVEDLKTLEKIARQYPGSDSES